MSRALALQVLQKWENGSHFAEDLLRPASASLPERDRAFVRHLVYGVLRNRLLLQHWSRQLRRQKCSARVERLLQLGLLETLLSPAPAAYASVNECVKLAGSAKALVNAVLRRSLRERGELLASVQQLPWETQYSTPAFLIQRWRAHFGEASTCALLKWNQEPAPLTVRWNRLQGPPPTPLPANWKPLPAWTDFYQVDSLPLAELSSGQLYVQDPSTSLATSLLQARPGERILDACAAPGGKTAQLAQSMNNTGQLFASDRDPQRLARLKDNLARLGVQNACLQKGDATRIDSSGEPFDGILLDTPCSNSGVFRRRIDARWRLSEAYFEEVTQLQRRMIESAWQALKPGGRLVYSTCSLDPEENEAVVRTVSETLPGLLAIESRDTKPFREGVDGAYAALLRKAPRD
ncbi:MAG: RsmB/NOP family class I SAM-dependent RNA methyltransferase [Verrucomicrobiota bacterium]